MIVTVPKQEFDRFFKLSKDVVELQEDLGASGSANELRFIDMAYFKSKLIQAKSIYNDYLIYS